MIKFIIFLLAITTTTFAQTIVYNSNGTISLVGNTLQKYTIDPNIKFRVSTVSDHSNEDYAGKKLNGMYAYRDSTVTAKVTLQSLSSLLVTGTSFQVFRSADLYLTYDPTKLEYTGLNPDLFGIDTSVIDTSKTTAQVVVPGIVKIHCQVLPKPANGTGYQWNFGGFIWTTGNNRMVAKLNFKVKGDFYYPVNQPTDIKLIEPTVLPDATVLKNFVDAGPILGTNLYGEVRNGINKIAFTASPAYKVNHSLVGPVNPVKVGEEISVAVMVTPATLPQIISAVTTIFTWDNTKLEFMGLDKTGAKASQLSAIREVAIGNINEAAIPKDGNASHGWLSLLGDKSYITSDTLIVKLKFKVLTQFNTTEVSIKTKADLPNLLQIEDTRIYGSLIGGSNVSGLRVNATIKGELYGQ